MNELQLTGIKENLSDSARMLREEAQRAPNDEHMVAAFKAWQHVDKALDLVCGELSQLSLDSRGQS